MVMTATASLVATIHRGGRVPFLQLANLGEGFASDIRLTLDYEGMDVSWLIQGWIPPTMPPHWSHLAEVSDQPGPATIQATIRWTEDPATAGEWSGVVFRFSGLFHAMQLAQLGRSRAVSSSEESVRADIPIIVDVVANAIEPTGAWVCETESDLGTLRVSVALQRNTDFRVTLVGRNAVWTEWMQDATALRRALLRLDLSTGGEHHEWMLADDRSLRIPVENVAVGVPAKVRRYVGTARAVRRRTRDGRAVDLAIVPTRSPLHVRVVAGYVDDAGGRVQTRRAITTTGFDQANATDRCTELGVLVYDAMNANG